MAQGKLKANKKVQSNLKGIKKPNKTKKGGAFTRRQNAPAKQKKNTLQESQKIKNVITKSLNQTMEQEIRARAIECSGSIKLSKAQQAVAKHNQQIKQEPSTSSA